MKVAKKALAEEKTVREVASTRATSRGEADEVLDPEKMTHRGILGDDSSPGEKQPSLVRAVSGRPAE